MKVKICGLTNVDDARAAVAAGADMVGFVFVPGTPRAVDPERAEWIRTIAGAATVGVFRDAPLEWMLAVGARLGLDRIQLHGSEPDAWFERLGPGVLRRVPVPSTGVDRDRVETLARLGALPLVDPGAGDGKVCDWDGVGRSLRGLAFGLAGGLTPATVADAIARTRPVLVDVSSGVEMRPGVKDHAKIASFVAAARAAAGRADRG